MSKEQFLKISNKLIDDQKKILQQISDMGFPLKERDYSIGYIRGVEDFLHQLYKDERIFPSW